MYIHLFCNYVEILKKETGHNVNRVIYNNHPRADPVPQLSVTDVFGNRRQEKTKFDPT